MHQQAIDTTCRLRQLASRCGIALDEYETPTWAMFQTSYVTEWGWVLRNSEGEAHYFGVDVPREYCVDVRGIGSMDFLEALEAAEKAAGIPHGVRDYSQDAWHQTLPEYDAALYRRVA